MKEQLNTEIIIIKKEKLYNCFILFWAFFLLIAFTYMIVSSIVKNEFENFNGSILVNLFIPLFFIIIYLIGFIKYKFFD